MSTAREQYDCEIIIRLVRIQGKCCVSYVVSTNKRTSSESNSMEEVNDSASSSALIIPLAMLVSPHKHEYELESTPGFPSRLVL